MCACYFCYVYMIVRNVPVVLAIILLSAYIRVPTTAIQLLLGVAVQRGSAQIEFHYSMHVCGKLRTSCITQNYDGVRCLPPDMASSCPTAVENPDGNVSLVQVCCA